MSQHFNILLGTVNLNNRIDIQKLLHHTEVRKWQELSRVGPKVNQVGLSPIMSSSTKFEVNPSNGLYANAWKQLNQSNGKNWNSVEHAWGIPYKDLTNQRPGYNGNLAEHEQKFYQAPGGWGVGALWVHPPMLRSIRPAICRELHKNCTTNQRHTVEHQSSLKSS